MKLPRSAESNRAYMCFESARTMKSTQGRVSWNGSRVDAFRILSPIAFLPSHSNSSLWVPLSFAHSGNETVDYEFRTLLK